ncbi:MAG: hypothetical protein EOP83_24405 [Verrucomicrobiaceae bacterium]|nr:MAG: hypothetical protein EOP83_24405 [Verrucomicrobiaceae bacterium]
MAVNTRNEPANATEVRLRLIELIEEDRLRDEILPWLNDRDRKGYYRIEQDYRESVVVENPGESQEDFIFSFSNALTAFEFKMAFG